MANEVKITITGDASGAEAAAKKTQGAFGRLTESIKKNRRAIGLAMTGAGAAITGLAGLAIKSSQAQQVGINRLDQALKNVGTTYGENTKAIEEVIAATQRKTNFGDEAQRDALQKLVTIGGQWKGSLEALQITTDVAAGANIDLSAAALLVGKAIAGETSSLSRYGILLKEGATQTEIMAALTKQFGGAAEAAADPFTQLKNRLGDMLQVLGDALLPTVQKAAELFERVTRRVIGWAEAHPGLAKVMAIVAAAVGGIMLVLGPLLLMLPALIAGISAFGVALTIATGPVGIITVAVAALVAGAILLWRNWDTVWGAIKSTTERVVNTLIDVLNKYTSVYRQMIIKMLEGVKAVVGWIPKIGDTMEKSLNTAIEALRRGIPEIDITAEKVREMGEGFGAAADVVANASKKQSDALEEAAARDNAALKEKLEVAEDVGAKMRAFFARSTQASIDAASREQAALTRIEAANEALRKEADERALTAIQAFNDERTRLNDLVLSGLAKAEVANRESIVEGWRKQSAENQRVLREQADAAERATKAISGSWQDFRLGQDSTIAAMRENSVGFGDIVEGLAERFGVSTLAMGSRIEGFGIKYNDTMGLIEQFGRTAIDAQIAKFAELAEAAKASARAVAQQPATRGEQVSQREAGLISNREALALQRLKNVQAGVSTASIDASLALVNSKLSDVAGLVEQESRLRVVNGFQFHVGEGVEGRAHGGPIAAGQPVIVGERRPELFVPSTSGTILPRLPSGGGGLTVNVFVSGDVNGVDDLEALILTTVRDNTLAGGGI